ncbi:MAG TPA: hypothetical protein EYP04_02470, partial [Anaerolineae bacterium]|nr:hypothetical protein [Anaerolineae bacterium]
SWGSYLGRINVTFDENGIATSWDGRPILVDETIPEDSVIAARVAELAQPIEEWRNTVIGQTAVDLDGERSSCRFRECNLGNLMTDAILERTAHAGTQIAIQNGGGIRKSVPAGDVTLGDVLGIHPFGNTIYIVDLTGAQVLEMFENGVSRAEDPGNEGTGRFSQVGGAAFTWDPTQPVGHRICSVTVAGEPLDMNATYRVATNNFLAGGGDGYSVFAEGQNGYDTGLLLTDAILDYFAAHSPVSPQVEGRIKLCTQGISGLSLDGPAQIEYSLSAGGNLPTLSGLVRVKGVTALPGAADGLRVQVGYGSAGTLPGTWTTWMDLSYTGEGGFADEYDVYTGTLATPTVEGTYRYLVRATDDAGRRWVYAGFRMGTRHGGTLIVTP